MNIILAKHYGMCFGVRDALKATKAAATSGPTTILGQLVHNEVVTEQLNQLGVRHGHLRNPDSAETPQVVITAHGAGIVIDRHGESGAFGLPTPPVHW